MAEDDYGDQMFDIDDILLQCELFNEYLINEGE